jgi:hypothetical protein
VPSTPRKSPRQAEEFRLRAEADGQIFQPAKPGTFYEARREGLVEEYVRAGLERFDEEQLIINPNP